MLNVCKTSARPGTQPYLHPAGVALLLLGARPSGTTQRAKGGFKYIFVAIDKFTKWIEYKPLVKYSAAKVIEFIQDIMHRFGMPNRVITDLGSPSMAVEFKSWAQDCGISIDYASVAHPQANGQVERANGLILAGLKPRLYEDLEDYGPKWIEELPKVVWGYALKSAEQSGTHCSS